VLTVSVRSSRPLDSPELPVTDVVWSYLVCRYWRGITWTFAWMLAFGAPTLVPIPVLGWFAPPLLFWVAVTSRRRRVQRHPPRYQYGPTA
jgi:hypothetical protein